MNQILVVEAEPDMAATYERVLRRAGHRVVLVASRAGGMQLLEWLQPRLVISDLRLPDGDGLDVVRAACMLDPPSPVLVVTGFASREARAVALACGAGAFLAKPFRVAEFSRLVEAMTTHHGAPRVE